MPFLLLNGSREEEKYYLALDGGAFLRETPSGTGKILLTIPAREEVKVIRKDGPRFIFLNASGNWFKIKYKEMFGWVFGPLIRTDINRVILAIDEGKLVEIPISAERFTNVQSLRIENNKRIEKVFSTVLEILGNSCLSIYQQTSCIYSSQSPVKVKIYPGYDNFEKNNQVETRGILDLTPSGFRLFKALLYALAADSQPEITTQEKDHSIKQAPEIIAVAHEHAIFQEYDYGRINEVWLLNFKSNLVMHKNRFPYYNSSAIKAFFERFYAAPSSNFNGTRMKIVYEKVVRNAFRYYAKTIYKIINSKIDFNEITRNYEEKSTHPGFFALSFLDETISRLPNYRFPDEIFEGSKKPADFDTNPFFWGRELFGFVLRRKIDGSFDTIWRLMGQIAQDYDPIYFNKYWVTAKK